jgi:hypothetical protein
MGNDYVEQETLAPFKQALFPERINKTTLIMSLANFISRSRNPSEALHSALDLVPNVSEKAVLKKDVENSLREYEISVGSLRGYFEQNEIRTSLETRQDKTIPAYVIRGYRDGLFPIRYLGALISGTRMLKVQVEDTSKESANMCSIKLRKVSYGIVTAEGPVKEYDRDDTDLVDQPINPFTGSVPEYGELPNLKNVREVDQKQRLKLLMLVLKADTTAIKSLPEKLQLFAASVRFWIDEADPRVNQTCVQALLLVHLKLLAESEDKSSPESSQYKKHEKRRLRGSFSLRSSAV